MVASSPPPEVAAQTESFLKLFCWRRLQVELPVFLRVRRLERRDYTDEKHNAFRGDIRRPPVFN